MSTHIQKKGLVEPMSLETARATIQTTLDNVGRTPYFAGKLFQPGGRLKSLGYDSQGRGQVTVQFRVGPEQGNSLGTLHGGVHPGLVEILSGFPLMLHTSGKVGDPWGIMGVNISLSVSYLAAVPVNSWVQAELGVDSIGRTLAFLRCNLYTLPDGPDGKRGKQFAAGLTTKMDNSAHFKPPPGYVSDVPLVEVNPKDSQDPKSKL